MTVSVFHVYASVESEQISGASNRAVSKRYLVDGRTLRREPCYYWSRASARLPGKASGKQLEESNEQAPATDRRGRRGRRRVSPPGSPRIPSPVTRLSSGHAIFASCMIPGGSAMRKSRGASARRPNSRLACLNRRRTRSSRHHEVTDVAGGRGLGPGWLTRCYLRLRLILLGRCSSRQNKPPSLCLAAGISIRTRNRRFFSHENTYLGDELVLTSRPPRRRLP